MYDSLGFDSQARQRHKKSATTDLSAVCIWSGDGCYLRMCGEFCWLPASNNSQIQDLMNLSVNRYNQTAPTAVQSNGMTISVPVYIAPTRGQLKAILNGFRVAVSERGDAAVAELGMDEAALRTVLFSRNGLPERLILKLQCITGIELVSREQIEATQQAWVDHLSVAVLARLSCRSSVARRFARTRLVVACAPTGGRCFRKPMPSLDVPQVNTFLMPITGTSSASDSA